MNYLLIVLGVIAFGSVIPIFFLKSWKGILVCAGIFISAVAAILIYGLTTKAHAASLDALVSVGIGKSVLDKKAFERYASLGVQYGAIWKVRANGGYWLALNDGEKASLYGSLQGGLDVVGSGGTYATVMFGPALIQHPDSKLGGKFQFHTCFGVGMKNDAGYGLAFLWQHFSNAGIVMPNNGRDLLTAQLVIPIYKWGK